jgi:hypothetical protein
MTTLLRTLKYTPALFMGLLIVAWGFSLFRQTILVVGNSFGSLGAAQFVIVIDTMSGLRPTQVAFRPLKPNLKVLDLTIGTELRFGSGLSADCIVHLPIVVLLTLLLPLGLGSFTKYRFRLWHYFAYMTLIALELMYYCRPN